MGVVAEAAVKLALRAEGFAAGVRQAGSQLDALANRIAGIGVRASVAGAAITGMVTGIVAPIAAAGDSLSKMSDRTGVSIQSLSELRHAFRMSGATLEDFERAFARMSNLMQEASREASAAATKHAEDVAEAQRQAAEAAEDLTRAQEALARVQRGSAPDAAAVARANRELDLAETRLAETMRRGNATRSQVVAAQNAVANAHEHLARARRGGVASEDAIRSAIERVSDASERHAEIQGHLTELIREGAQATGVASDTLRTLGITLEELEALSPEERFLRFGAAVAEVADENARLAISSDVFERKGRQLLPLFAAGSDELARLRQEAHDLGVALTDEEGRALETFTDNWTNVGEAIRGLRQTIALQLRPSLDSFAIWLQDHLIKLREWAEEHEGLVSMIFKIITGLGVFLTVAGPVLLTIAALVKTLSYGATVINGTWIALRFLTVGTAASGTAAVGARAGFASLWALLAAHPLIALTAAIVGIVAAIVTWREGWGVLWDTLRGTFADLARFAGWLLMLPVRLLVALSDLGNLFLDWWNGVGESLGIALADMWEGFTAKLRDAAAEIGAWFSQLGAWIEATPGAIIGFLRAPWDAVTGWFDDLLGWIGGLGSRAFAAGARLVESVWDGMKSIWDRLRSWWQSAMDWFGGSVDEQIEPIVAAAEGALGMAKLPTVGGGARKLTLSAGEALGIGSRGAVAMAGAGAGGQTFNFHVTFTGPINSEIDVESAMRRVWRGAKRGLQV